MSITSGIAPSITDQQPLATTLETSLTITLDDVVVIDPDNTYPAGSTLTVYDGANYDRMGNTITPVAGFTGELIVPVTVSDGTNISNFIYLSVTVKAGSGMFLTIPNRLGGAAVIYLE